MPYLIDEVLPTNRIHLLGGVSDAGKTRWVLPAMLDWEAGKNVLGRASHPCPWAYVIGDRLEVEAHDTMNSMGINPASVRCIPAFGAHNKNWLQILIAAAALRPIPQLLVIEGFSDLPETDTRVGVRTFLGSVGSFCQGAKEFPQGLTILGIVESPKQKPFERYKNPRHRVSGVSAWGYHSSTILLLEGDKGDDELLLPTRTLWVCMKNGIRRKVQAAFDQKGRLLSP